MTEGGKVSVNSLGIRLVLVSVILIFTASCASIDCDFDTRAYPDPISITAEEGALWGQNYTACFIIDGVVHKEYIPECAYKYYYAKLQAQSGR